MRTHAPIIAVTGILYLFTLFSGVWLSRSLGLNDPRHSRVPISGVIFAVHTLIALGTVIFAGVTIRGLAQTSFGEVCDFPGAPDRGW
jgi:hypothetical protein